MQPSLDGFLEREVAYHLLPGQEWSGNIETPFSTLLPRKKHATWHATSIHCHMIRRARAPGSRARSITTT